MNHQLTEDQIEAVCQWMQQHEATSGIVLHLFRKDFIKKDPPDQNICAHENRGDDWGTIYCLDCSMELMPGNK